MARCWKKREDEFSRTTFAGQLSIDGDEQAETLVVPKREAVRETEGSTRAASSLAGEDDAIHDTPMF